MLSFIIVQLCFYVCPRAKGAVPGVSPGRGLLILLGYLHPGKCEHSEVQSHRSHRDYKKNRVGIQVKIAGQIEASNGGQMTLSDWLTSHSPDVNNENSRF